MADDRTLPDDSANAADDLSLLQALFAAVKGGILPRSVSTRAPTSGAGSLGSAAHRWRRIYARRVLIGVVLALPIPIW